MHVWGSIIHTCATMVLQRKCDENLSIFSKRKTSQCSTNLVSNLEYSYVYTIVRIFFLYGSPTLSFVEIEEAARLGHNQHLPWRPTSLVFVLVLSTVDCSDHL